MYCFIWISCVGQDSEWSWRVNFHFRFITKWMKVFMTHIKLWCMSTKLKIRSFLWIPVNLKIDSYQIDDRYFTRFKTTDNYIAATRRKNGKRNLDYQWLDYCTHKIQGRKLLSFVFLCGLLLMDGVTQQVIAFGWVINEKFKITNICQSEIELSVIESTIHSPSLQPSSQNLAS